MLGFAVAAVGALAVAVTTDLELGLRSEARTTALTTPTRTAPARTAVSAEPRATALAAAPGLRLGATWAPRIWTSDVGTGGDPLVDQSGELQLTARRERWRAAADARATRGWTDPLAGTQLSALTGARLPRAAPLRFEALHAGARAERALSHRTALAAAAGWTASRGTDAEARALLPAQSALSLSASAAHALAPRDGLTLSASGQRTVTRGAGDATADTATGLATWRRRLTPRVDGWAGAGAAVESASGRVGVGPAAELGVSRASERMQGRLAARLEPAVDRLSGEASDTASAAASLEWAATHLATLTTTALASTRTDGRTALAALDARVRWRVKLRLFVEAGALARWQHDRRTATPSFLEAGAFAGVVWESGPLIHPPVP